MKSKWNEKAALDKILFVARIIASVVVMVCALLQLLDVWHKALYAAVPLLSVVILLQSVQEHRAQRKASAIVGYVCFVLMLAMMLGVILP